MAEESKYLGDAEEISEMSDENWLVIVTNDGIRRIKKHFF